MMAFVIITQSPLPHKAFDRLSQPQIQRLGQVDFGE